MNRHGVSEQLRVLANLEALSIKAAEHVVQVVTRHVRASGWASIALCGGSTVHRLYELLADHPYRHRIPWDRVLVFWADERCVPPDDPASNFGLAWRLLLSKVPMPPEHLHRVPTERGDVGSIAAAYEAMLRNAFRLPDGAVPTFSLVLLGLGTDGHTASLFPRSAGLREAHRLVVATSGGHPDVARVSLAAPVLNHAADILWLVAGAHKAAVMQAVLEGPEQPDELPAQRIRPVHGMMHWLIDRAAARQLSRIQEESRAPRPTGTPPIHRP